MIKIPKDIVLETLEVLCGNIELSAAELGISEKNLSELISEYGIDLSPILDELAVSLKENKMKDISDPTFDLVLAYTYKQFPEAFEETHAEKVFDRIKQDSARLISFIKKVDQRSRKEVGLDRKEIISNQRKLKVYARFMNLYCKGQLRRNTDSILWDDNLNRFCLRLKPEIQNFLSKGCSISYSDIFNEHIFNNGKVEFPIPAKSLLFVLSDILSVRQPDANFFSYYLAVLGSKDASVIKEIWAFDKFINLVKIEKIIQKS